jgi:hypothetical protein
MAKKSMKKIIDKKINKELKKTIKGGKRGYKVQRSGGDRELLAIKRLHRTEDILRSKFRDSILYPDLAGPFRAPRPGGSERTGLGTSLCHYIFGSLSSFQMCRLNPSYLVALNTYTAASPAAPWVASTDVNSVSVFPAINQIDDWNLTSGCLIVSYIGSPLNAKGELIFGSTPYSSLTTASFDSLTYYPGSVRVPISSLLENPIRIPLTKLSQEAYGFVATGTSNGDLNLPFVALSPVSESSSIVLQVVKHCEYRSTVVTGLVVPYALQSESYSADVSAYSDAAADVGSTPNASSLFESYSEPIGRMMNSMVPSILNGAQVIGNAAIQGASHYVAAHTLNALRGGMSRGAYISN